ncbi:PQQ-binding-like beta-propeller repeat protein, partial [Pedobacter sp.]|uniref:outer membrane protein assembly factor BamB family protein n=1 Tax=Pedobacter sp. TaxID=1411316 RepID=UPI002D0C8718
SDDGLRFRSSTAKYIKGNIYVTGINALFVIDPLSGKTLQKIEAPYEFKVMASPLVTDEHIIMATARNGVVAYDLKTLKEVWNRPTGNALVYSAPYTGPESATVEGSVLRYKGKLLFGASDGFFYVLDEKTGGVLQKMNLGSPVFADVSVSNDTAFIADFAGNVFAVALK